MMGGFCVAGWPGKAPRGAKKVLKMTDGPQDEAAALPGFDKPDFSFQLRKVSCHCRLGR